MKKIIALLLASMLMLIGCGKTIESTVGDNSSDDTNSISGEVSKRPPPEPDPTVSGSLSVQMFGLNSSQSLGSNPDRIDKAMSEFRRRYPNVLLKVTRGDLQNRSADEYTEAMTADLMTGSAPDFIWCDYLDVEKLMAAGKLADMSGYFQQDSDFDEAEYNTEVLYGGQPKGKQYFVPLNYYLPMYISSKSILDEIDFVPEDYTNYFSMYEKMAELQAEREGKLTVAWGGMPYRFPGNSGLDWINLNTGVVDLSLKELQTGFNICKTAFYPVKELRSTVGSDIVSGGAALSERKALFLEETGSPCNLLNVCQLIDNGDEAVIFPWRDVNGNISASLSEVVAVSQSSTNQENAYRLIQILLSPEIQAQPMSTYHNMQSPISKTALQEVIGHYMDGLSIPPVSDELMQKYLSYHEEIARVEHSYGGSLKILSEAMQPYFSGEKSYEECIEAAKVGLDAYVSG